MVQARDDRDYQKPLAVALQGGGTYGAFAWGVLDRLLEEADFDPVAFSGSSAGAVNATLTAWGLLIGGRDEARRVLRRFWEAVGQMSRLSPMRLPGAHLQFDLLTRVASPYQLNPLNINPMRDLLAETIDFERLQQECPRALFIAATDVESGDLRIFRESEVSVDVLMASTCIPYLHHAVEMEGRQHWDGGFSANPPVLPMVLETNCRSVLVVKLTPDAEVEHPTTAPAIFSRLKRILFNTPLMRELDALEQMQGLLRRTALSSPDLRRIRDLGLLRATIGADFFNDKEGGALHPRPDFLEQLYAAGRAEAEHLVPVRAQSIPG
ncbi:MAG TPA: patatin-like phospholipase family protein [Magnetospirillum sp.]|nr:patatin-like phospholipase family protein [Magnetospirillum sp.]